jgi:hypothetical protein
MLRTLRLAQETARDVRLLRLQVGNIASRLFGIEGRVGTLEQAFHELVGETARGFGQVQLTRHEKRFDMLDVGLASLRGDLAESTDQILRAIGRTT